MASINLSIGYKEDVNFYNEYEKKKKDSLNFFNILNELSLAFIYSIIPILYPLGLFLIYARAKCPPEHYIPLTKYATGKSSPQK
jgi:hypothetical protein